MKSRHAAPLHLVLIALMAACASSGRRTQPADKNTVSAEDVAQHAHEPLEVMLQRKFPGVQVLRNADGDIILNIRGATSATGTPRDPLYIINDMEVDPGGRGLSSIVNPYDIESIKVLKGSEAAIYGIRGADGVIVIKTKSPKPIQ
jgi:TonB-dependent SusC/RagA subfamily outer membrane receptor